MQIILPNLLLIIVSSHFGSSQYIRKGPISTVYRWKQLEFQYTSPELRQQAINNREFIPANIVPLGIERWKDRLFIATPRWKKGVPATLSTLPIVSATQSPMLKPYPSMNWSNAGNCTGFTSIYRMNIDQCGVMWALDSGVEDALGELNILCPPTLLAINLNTDTVIGRYPIPSEFVLQNSLFANIIVDSRDEWCRDLHVYLADLWRYGLVVFRNKDKAFWRFNHYTFYPEPLLSNYTLHGFNFQWTDGLFGMSLSNIQNGDRLLYYNAMSSSLQFVVPTSVIRDPARVDSSTNEFKLLGSRGENGQVTATAIDRNGVMYFNLISQDSIGYWDTRKPYSSNNLMVLERNSNTLVFPNELRIDQEVYQTAWLLSNKVPMFQNNLINPNDYNYRVLRFDPVAVVNTLFVY